MSVGREQKDPATIESFGFDYEDDLAVGDTLASSAWSFERHDGTPTVELTEVAKSNTPTTAAIRVSGGAEGTTYKLRNTVVTTHGDTLKRSLLLDVFKE